MPPEIKSIVKFRMKASKPNQSTSVKKIDFIHIRDEPEKSTQWVKDSDTSITKSMWIDLTVGEPIYVSSSVESGD